MLDILNSFPPEELPRLLKGWESENPLSDLIFQIELKTRMLEIHARLALSRGDLEGYAPINALMCGILDEIRKFTQNVTERIENDEPGTSAPAEPSAKTD